MTWKIIFKFQENIWSERGSVSYIVSTVSPLVSMVLYMYVTILKKSADIIMIMTSSV